MARIELAGVGIEIIRKDIRNLHLSVLPPLGQVRIAAPRQMPQEAIRAFAISKLAWIRRQQGRLQAQERETPLIYRNRESHYLWGRRYLLLREERDAAPVVELRRGRLILQVRPGTDAVRCHEVLDGWYRAQIRIALAALLAKWEPQLGVRAQRVIVQRMKSKWGAAIRPAASFG